MYRFLWQAKEKKQKTLRQILINKTLDSCSQSYQIIITKKTSHPK
jgi:hypothetical protein